MFRPESIEYSRSRSQGTVVLAHPLSHGVLTWLFSAIAVAVVLFFVLAGVTRKADVRGVLLPAHGLIRVLCTQAGIVLERRVQEGQVVKAGDVMFVLGSERASKRDGNVDQTIASLLQTRRDSLSNEQRQLRQQTAERAEATQRKAAGLAAEIRRIGEQRTLQQRRVALAEAALQRLVTLQSSGFVSAADVQDKQAELLDQQQRLADLDRAQAATERDLDAVRDTLRELPLQAARELQAGQRDIATLEQDLTENDARRRVLVRAPQDGTVTAITADPGQPAALQQALASLLPAGSQLEAELYAPSRAAGVLTPGMPVVLRDPAYP
jgi:membrane fusion protein